MRRSLAGFVAVVLAGCVGLAVSAARADDGASQPTSRPAYSRVIVSFEEGNPFTTGELIREFVSDRIWPIVQGEIVSEHATEGYKALKVSDGALILKGPMDWRGWDFLKLDVFNSDSVPQRFGIEAQDVNSQDYWNQIRYTAVLNPGENTVILPLNHIRNGGKSRPKKPTALGEIRLLALKVYNAPEKPVFIDNVRFEKDSRMDNVLFDGLRAFSFGSPIAPVFPSFTRVDSTMEYTKERGFGLKGAQVQGPGETKGGMDGFHPDPLYRTWLNMEKGSFLVDLPNGKYKVFLNIDNPTGFWGEYQVYRTRKVMAQGQVVVDESMDFDALKKKYFRNYANEDLPGEGIWERYVKPMFHEKTFDVEVTDGQLKLEFDSKGPGCSVSALVIYPADKDKLGQKFLSTVEGLRKWYFKTECKQIGHAGTGAGFAPSDADKQRGMVVFNRDVMLNVFYNDKPVLDQPEMVDGLTRGLPRVKMPLDRLCEKLDATVLPGESTPIEFSIIPTKALGKVTLTVSDLAGAKDSAISAKNVEVGYASYRVTRLNLDGTAFTLAPALVMPIASVDAREGIARRFWLRLNTPKDAAAGLYKGSVMLDYAGGKLVLPLEVKVLKGQLADVDIPAGPFGYQIGIPWVRGDPAAQAWDADMNLKSLHKIFDVGFTGCSGYPVITYKGFEDGKPVLDFSVGDAQMKLVREVGFKMPFVNYCAFNGLNLYQQDTEAMRKAGFTDYSEFIKAIFSAVQKHADENNWLPVYWNLGDEPAGKEALEAATANLKAYRKAFPNGSPSFTFCGSCTVGDPSDPHFAMASSAHLALWNLHTEDSVNALHKLGGQWGFYNGGCRWDFGDYMFKCAKQFDMKLRPCWLWNGCIGDPYYALDCREDDYAWCVASPQGELVSTLFFERLREGLTDYRRLLTLQKLAKEKAGTPAAQAADKIIADRMASFKLDERDHDKLLGVEDWKAFRTKVQDAIEAMNQ